MNWNLNSGYGAHLANAIMCAGQSGKIFIVGASGLAYRDQINQLFQGDPDGKVRFSATIAGAVSLCTANGNDQILVLPGHTETITGAAGIAINVAGVAVVGLGVGAQRPTITFTTAVGASFDVTAASVLIKNIIFVCGIDNQTAMNNVTAADVTFDSCEWRVSDGTVGAAIGILTAATATRLKVENSRFVGPAVNAGTTLAAAIQHESGTDYVIQNNYFAGKATQMIKNVATVLRGVIHNNRFVVGTGTVAITMAAASTPFITNNRINVASGTAPIVAAAGFVAGNAYSAAAGVTAGTASTF